MNRQPFFVIGAPRSGTTMLQMALDRHSQIVLPPETHFFTLVRRSRVGQLRHWSRIQKHLQIQLGPITQRIQAGALAQEQYNRMADAYIEKLEKPGITHFGEKSPEHQLQTSLILKTFPEAKFVLIYRDGRDVALSLSKAPWMPRNLYVNYFVWLHYYRIQRRLLQQEPQRVICVRYEDFVTHPEEELRLLTKFLHLDYEPQMLEANTNQVGIRADEMAHKARALEPITSTRIGNWRRELTRKQIVRLERWGGWALRELHYECETKARSLLPPWFYLFVYARLAAEVSTRSMKRMSDDWFGTSFYRPNRLARDLPEPPQGVEEFPEITVRTSPRAAEIRNRLSPTQIVSSDGSHQ